jgi:hypothetical protein
MTDTTLANSYVTATEADAYFDGDPRADAFLAGDTEWYLKKATSSIDALNYAGFEYLDPIGSQVWTNGNVKKFPRKYIPSNSVSPWGVILGVDAFGYIYDSSGVPTAVKDACCEEALAIYNEINDADLKLRRKLQQSGVSSVGFRGRSESYQANALDYFQGLKSREAYLKLTPYISNYAIID